MTLAVLSPALLACGTKWGRQYVLAESGSHDCSGCGKAIDSYEACGEAAETGATALGIGGLGLSENWGGPPGCHIQDGSNFQWNANAYGDRADGHTPVCLVTAKAEFMVRPHPALELSHPPPASPHPGRPLSLGLHRTQVSSASMTYDEGVAHCAASGSKLAAIYDTSELAAARAAISAAGVEKAITSASSDGSGWAWHGTERWEEGGFPLNTGQVTDQREGMAGSTYSLHRSESDFVWDADGRGERHPVLCRLSPPSPDNNWRNYVRAPTGANSWNEASVYCTQNHDGLAIINSAEENLRAKNECGVNSAPALQAVDPQNSCVTSLASVCAQCAGSVSLRRISGTASGNG